MYHGTKFISRLSTATLPEEAELEGLKKSCKLLNDWDLAPSYTTGSHGNVSRRVRASENKFIITCSQTDFSKPLSAKQFATVNHCDFDTKTVFADGVQKPSSESMLHFAIYQSRTDVNAIVHGHSHKILENSKKLGLIETRQEEEYGTIELVHSVLEFVAKHNFIVMKNHGFIAFGENFAEAWQEIQAVYDRLSAK